jgi:hypothetical protein
MQDLKGIGSRFFQGYVRIGQAIRSGFGFLPLDPFLSDLVP